jgi:hypothetical protein
MGPYKISSAADNTKKASPTKKATIKLSPGQQKLLNAVASFAARNGNHTASRPAVMTACGYTKRTAGGFAILLSTLKTKKVCLTYTSDAINLTDVGRQLAEAVEIVASLTQARGSLTGKKSKLLFDFLVQEGAATRSRRHSCWEISRLLPRRFGRPLPVCPRIVIVVGRAFLSSFGVVGSVGGGLCLPFAMYRAFGNRG